MPALFRFLAAALFVAGGAFCPAAPTDTVVVGTARGLYRLTGSWTGTAAWQAEAVLPAETRSVRALAFDPASGTVLAGSVARDGGALHLSRDRGVTWEAVSSWPRERQAWAAGFAGDGSPLVGSQPADIWQARTLAGPWTANASIQAIPERAKWSFIRAPYEAHFITLARDPRRSGHWLAAIERGGVLLSEDDGKTWQLRSPFWDAHVVAFLPGGEFVAATGEGLQVSRDRGANWTTLTAPSGYASGLAVDADGTAWAAVMGARTSALWSSRDAGRTWQPVPGTEQLPHPDHGVHALAAVPGHPGLFVYGGEKGVWLVRAGEARQIARNLPEVLRVLPLSGD